MFTIIIAALCGCGVAAAFNLTGTANWGWSFCWGVITMFVLQMASGFFIRKQVMKAQVEIQKMMAETQAKLARRIEMFQRRPGGNVKLMQQEMQEEQYSAIRKSLYKLNELNRYVWWSPMLEKQLNTSRMVMYYQLKEFDKADNMMKSAIMVTGQAIAMKMARMYKRNDPGLDKFFAKKSKRLKGDDAVLIYSLYAWIKLKQDDPKSALDALNRSLKKSDNKLLLENRDRIANGKLKQFSNALLGDAWYALYLEEPKVHQQRMERRFQ
ncbi:MAG: hypothetical protein AB7F40_01575 [Victivallaceae bacterium]|nr:hypothetical protein [Victivallaceae bacterium]